MYISDDLNDLRTRSSPSPEFDCKVIKGKNIHIVYYTDRLGVRLLSLYLVAVTKTPPEGYSRGCGLFQNARRETVST